jgi:porphobilinogen synthase
VTTGAGRFSGLRAARTFGGKAWKPLDIAERPRRNRKSAAVRAALRETHLAPAHLVLPLFIHAGEDDIPVASMPGCARLSLAGLLKEVEGAVADGIGMVEVFPAVQDSLKTADASEAFNPDGLVPTAVRMLKERWPELVVITDVALDPYSAHGHDGLVRESDGEILNDATVAVLCKQALCHAEAGVDIVAPSDMMDGRVEAIRDALDGAGYENVSILSYTAKYASGFYGPFREALDSSPRATGKIPSHKRSYQMDPANRREALREAALDESEGADYLMVKPAVPYLDIISDLRDESTLPIVAYHVSGEYAMLKAACLNGWLDSERRVVLETLLSIRRAGADMIFTYYARPAARWLRELDVERTQPWSEA